MERVTHGIEPVFDAHSRVLLLGTMPSPASRAAGFYYMHPQNRMWRVLCALLGERLPADVAGRRALLLRHGIAMWDVLAACEIEGAADASIRQAVPNDLCRVLVAADIRGVFTTGKAAKRLYDRHCLPQTGMPAVCLPSTSAANAAWRLDALVKAYAALLEYL